MGEKGKCVDMGIWGSTTDTIGLLKNHMTFYDTM